MRIARTVPHHHLRSLLDAGLLEVIDGLGDTLDLIDEKEFVEARTNVGELLALMDTIKNIVRRMNLNAAEKAAGGRATAK